MQDWIKMRTDLYRDPKVSIMADHLMKPEGLLAQHVKRNTGGDMTVTRDVMRCATVGATLATWGVMRHRGKRNGDDLVCNGVTLAVIDDISDLPGFGEAMKACGWVVDENGGIKFPRFFSEYNVQVDDKGKSSAAARQARYRASKKPKSDGDSNVTGGATGDGREEESREEKLATNRDDQNGKPEHPGGIDDVIIPKKMQTTECQHAAAQWMAYLDEKGLGDKRPDGAIALQAWWAQMARIGPKDFPIMVERSISGAHWSVKVLPDPTKDFAGPARVSKPTEDRTDWHQALTVCRRYPSGSQQDSEERKIQMTPEQLQAARAVGFQRIAGSTSFDAKQIEAEFLHALKGVKL